MQNFSVTKFLRDVVCFNQGGLVQYSYLGGIFHKELKEGMLSSSKDLQHIENLFFNLTEFLNRNFLQTSRKNFEFLHSYYHGRSDINPRICLKAEYHGKIVELFRDKEVNYISEYEINTNTGFKEVCESGRYFLCNNIPEKAKKGDYLNPRLIPSEVSKYPSSYNIFKSKKHSKDDNWIKCWENKFAEDSCYKSTLIIPITLWNNDLSEQFKQVISVSNIERSIFGFLCFDHVDIDFFNEIDDVNIGYIFADISSLYILHRLNFTKLSQTFNAAQTLIEKKS